MAEYLKHIGIGLGSIFLVSCVFFLQKFMRQCWQLRFFRGPLAIPLVGNCYTTEALFFLRNLSSLRKRFGRIFTFFAFTKPYLVVCEPNTVRRVLSDTKTFCKGSDYTEQFSVAFGEGLVTSNGEKHKKDRAVFGKYFIRSNISKYMPIVNAKSLNAIATMLDPTVTGGQPGDVKVHNIEHFFALLSLRVFMAFCLNYDYTTGDRPEREEALCKAVSNGSWAIGRMITLGLPMWNIFPALGTIKAAQKELWADLSKIIDERKLQIKRGECEHLDDCLSALIAEDMGEKDTFDHLVTLLSAGHDTTAYFCSYMCYLLATNMDAQDTLRAEINAVMQGRREVTADDVLEMKYLAKVMQETLRLYSIIPCVTRYATEEVHIKEANITIPRGANLLIPMFLINRDPELWENPSKFVPERFEGRGNEFTSAKNGFFPFGYGSRTCIGNVLSQV